MTFFYIAFFAAFICLFFKKKHETIIVYGIMSILLQPYMCVKYSPPALTLKFMMDFVIFVNCLFNNQAKFRDFPLKNIFSVLFASWIISIFVSPMNSISLLPGVLQRIISYFMVFIIYAEIFDKNDINLMMKSFILTYTILLSVGIIEYIMQQNYFLDYISNTVPTDDLKGKLYHSKDGEVRFGSIRCQSLFSISISWGGFCCLFLGMLIILREQIVNLLGNKKFWFLFVTSIFSAFSSGTRSCYLFLAVILLSYIFLDSSIRKYRILYIVIFLLSVFYYSDILYEIIKSFTSDTDVSGSSSEMRQIQLMSVIKVLENSLFWGLGFKGYLIGFDLDNDILGAESVWFQILLERGIIGVFIQLCLYFYTCKYMLHSVSKIKKVICFFYVVGWVSFVSLTSTPGLDDNFFILIVILISTHYKLCNNIYKT